MAETILVVEDEPAIRELIGFACESSGYAVLRAGSVKEASDLLSQNRVHLILLDWMLPDLSGLQWLDKLKRDERYAAVPVIMLRYDWQAPPQTGCQPTGLRLTP